MPATYSGHDPGGGAALDEALDLAIAQAEAAEHALDEANDAYAELVAQRREELATARRLLAAADARIASLRGELAKHVARANDAEATVARLRRELGQGSDHGATLRRVGEALRAAERRAEVAETVNALLSAKAPDLRAEVGTKLDVLRQRVADLEALCAARGKTIETLQEQIGGCPNPTGKEQIASLRKRLAACQARVEEADATRRWWQARLNEALAAGESECERLRARVFALGGEPDV